MIEQLSITAVLKIGGKIRAVQLNIECFAHGALDYELLEPDGRGGWRGWRPIESEKDRKAVLGALKARIAKLAEVDLEKATQR